MKNKILNWKSNLILMVLMVLIFSNFYYKKEAVIKTDGHTSSEVLRSGESYFSRSIDCNSRSINPFANSLIASGCKIDEKNSSNTLNDTENQDAPLHLSQEAMDYQDQASLAEGNILNVLRMPIESRTLKKNGQMFIDSYYSCVNGDSSYIFLETCHQIKGLAPERILELKKLGDRGEKDATIFYMDVLKSEMQSFIFKEGVGSANSKISTDAYEAELIRNKDMSDDMRQIFIAHFKIKCESSDPPLICTSFPKFSSENS